MRLAVADRRVADQPRVFCISDEAAPALAGPADDAALPMV